MDHEQNLSFPPFVRSSYGLFALLVTNLGLQRLLLVAIKEDVTPFDSNVLSQQSDAALILTYCSLSGSHSKIKYSKRPIYSNKEKKITISLLSVRVCAYK